MYALTCVHMPTYMHVCSSHAHLHICVRVHHVSMCTCVSAHIVCVHTHGYMGTFFSTKFCFESYDKYFAFTAFLNLKSIFKVF